MLRLRWSLRASQGGPSLFVTFFYCGNRLHIVSIITWRFEFNLISELWIFYFLFYRVQFQLLRVILLKFHHFHKRTSASLHFLSCNITTTATSDINWVIWRLAKQSSDAHSLIYSLSFAFQSRQVENIIFIFEISHTKFIFSSNFHHSTLNFFATKFRFCFVHSFNAANIYPSLRFLDLATFSGRPTEAKYFSTTDLIEAQDKTKSWVKKNIFFLFSHS